MKEREGRNRGILGVWGLWASEPDYAPRDLNLGRGQISSMMMARLLGHDDGQAWAGAVGTQRHVGLVPCLLRRQAHLYSVDHHSRSRLRSCLQLLEASWKRWAWKDRCVLGWEEEMGQGKVEEMEQVEEMKVEEMEQTGLEGGSRGYLGGGMDSAWRHPCQVETKEGPMGIPDRQLDLGGQRVGAGRGTGVHNDSNFLTSPRPGPLILEQWVLCDLDQESCSHQQSQHQGRPAAWQEGRP